MIIVVTFNRDNNISQKGPFGQKVLPLFRHSCAHNLNMLMSQMIQFRRKRALSSPLRQCHLHHSLRHLNSLALCGRRQSLPNSAKADDIALAAILIHSKLCPLRPLFCLACVICFPVFYLQLVCVQTKRSLRFRLEQRVVSQMSACDGPAEPEPKPDQLVASWLVRAANRLLSLLQFHSFQFQVAGEFCHYCCWHFCCRAALQRSTNMACSVLFCETKSVGTTKRNGYYQAAIVVAFYLPAL